VLANACRLPGRSMGPHHGDARGPVVLLVCIPSSSSTLLPFPLDCFLFFDLHTRLNTTDTTPSLSNSPISRRFYQHIQRSTYSRHHFEDHLHDIWTPRPQSPPSNSDYHRLERDIVLSTMPRTTLPITPKTHITWKPAT
jgi:hypothetical protein